MALRSSIYLLAFIFSTYQLSAQTLHWYHVDESAMQPAGFRYYNDVHLLGERIVLGYMTEPRYDPGFYGFGDVGAKEYDTNGNFISQTESVGDSLFIRKTLLLSNGEKMVLGNTYTHYALYDLDTTIALGMWGEVRSFIHHLSANDETIRFTAFDEVMDIVTDASQSHAYLVNLYNFNEADVLEMDIATGTTTTLAYIEGARFYPVLLKTDDYLYITGASIEPEVHINENTHATEFDYTNVIIQFNQDGTYNWIEQVEDITTSHLGMAAAPQQGIYFSCDLYQVTNLGAHTVQGPTWGSDFYITRIDADGNFLWATEAPNTTLCDFTIASGCHLDSDDAYNVFIAGGTRDLLVWPDGTTVGRDTFIYTPTMLKYDAEGNLVGDITAEAGQSGMFYSMDVNGNGDLVLTGLINDNFTFDGQGHFVIDDDMHPYVLYYKNETASAGSMSNEEGFSIYPNVLGANQPLQISRNTTVRETLTVFDIHGRIAHTENIQGMQNNVQLPALPAGSYVVQVGNRKGERVIVN